MSADKIKEYITLTLLMIVFVILSALPLTVSALLCSALSAAILGYITTRYHYKYVIFTALISFVVFALFAGNPIWAFIAFLPMILGGLTLGIGYNVCLSPIKTIAIFSTISVLDIVTNMKIMTSKNGNDFLSTAFGGLEDVYSEIFAVSGVSQHAETEIKTLVSEIISVLMQFLPAFIVIACFLFALISFYFFKRICAMRKIDLTTLTPFSDWRLEKSVAVIYFIVLVLSMFLPEKHLLSDAIRNIVAIMSFVFFIYGMSLTEHILKKHIQKSWCRKLILLLIFFFSTLTVGIFFFTFSIAGAMDPFFDYRKKRIKHR